MLCNYFWISVLMLGVIELLRIALVRRCLFLFAVLSPVLCLWWQWPIFTLPEPVTENLFADALCVLIFPIFLYSFLYIVCQNKRSSAILTFTAYAALWSYCAYQLDLYLRGVRVTLINLPSRTGALSDAPSSLHSSTNFAIIS